MSRVVPDLRSTRTPLSDDQRQQVLTRVSALRRRCGACGNDGFRVGDALYLGFLFASEDLDSYMVALTCTNAGCPAPRTGITLPGHEFLES